MIVNADRQGPKDMLQQAIRLNAAKEHHHAQAALKKAIAMTAEGYHGEGDNDITAHYNRAATAQQHLLQVHDGDTAAAQASLNEYASRLGQGKGF